MNNVDKNGIIPLFAAITSIRNAGRESDKSVETIKFLLEKGADIEFRTNPQPLAFKREMNAKEYLTTSAIDFVFNLKAPDAPRVLALFSDDEVMKSNRTELDYYRRALSMNLIWLSVVNREMCSLPLIVQRLCWCTFSPGHSQRRDPVATFDHSDIRGLVTA